MYYLEKGTHDEGGTAIFLFEYVSTIQHVKQMFDN